MIAIQISTIIIIGLIALIVGMMIGVSLGRPRVRQIKNDNRHSQSGDGFGGDAACWWNYDWNRNDNPFITSGLVWE